MTDRANRVAIGGLVALALGVRLFELPRESLWLDEAGRVAIASLPATHIAHGVAVVELSPPLYHYLLGLWLKVAGDGDASVRLLSVLLAVPTIPLAWWLGRAAGSPSVGFGVAALAALSPFAVRYGREAAMYALLLPFSLLAVRAAIGMLSAQHPGVMGGPPAGSALRGMSGRWLALYVVAGTLALYTHYYSALLLMTVAAVGITTAATGRAWKDAALWAGAHLAIGVAFLPWLPTFIQQAGLAASVEEWGGVDPLTAVATWSSALLAGSLSDVPGALTAALLTAGVSLGAWRLRQRPSVMWLMLALVVIPLVLATVASGYLHSFRERGFIAVAAAPWVLIAAAVLDRRSEDGGMRFLDSAVRSGIALAFAVISVVGLHAHFAEQKEDWRGAARAVAATASVSDPIFFVHFGGQLAFDRYLSGPQPRVGLPANFSWEDGYHARYWVTADDVARVALPWLTGRSQAWAVLSHDDRRGSDHLLAALASWGELIDDQSVVGVRVLRFRMRSARPARRCHYKLPA